ncbi:hypothetical protein A2154_00890 [Candidatus Gottesmanbacteria bacterium RBG_16_43_7]|uniref:Uncharacterized protein n=1 Tax=Candidatus Gottesmanbacteria bacterium RBG_16_43_7 TaxID=1798373 RepID=A0A1F5Z9S8_9BACT|nr:MAG: hypothetical protein A2154_00890 [Candidatus Gottesmanbacteria bacterium RBG_16_43_7]
MSISITKIFYISILYIDPYYQTFPDLTDYKQISNVFKKLDKLRKTGHDKYIVFLRHGKFG